MIRVLRFKQEYRANRDPIDLVLVAPLGADFDKTQTWHRVSKIRPPETDDHNILESLSYQDMTAKWSIIGPQYEAWKSGSELPETGTPLAAWSGVTGDQAKHMQGLGIRTVEDVAAMGESTIEKLRIPDARRLPALASKWLKGADAASKDAEIEVLKEQMTAMAELLEERVAADSKAAAKPKAPRKAQATEAAA